MSSNSPHISVAIEITTVAITVVAPNVNPFKFPALPGAGSTAVEKNRSENENICCNDYMVNVTSHDICYEMM